MKWAIMINLRSVPPFMFGVNSREEAEALMDILGSDHCPPFFKGKTVDNVSFIVRTVDIACMYTMDLDKLKEGHQQANMPRVLGNVSGYQPLR